MISHFLRPRTVDEALDMREQYGAQACWGGGLALAGNEKHRCSCVIALDGIRVYDQSLAHVHHDDETLRIGALLSLQEMIDRPDIPAVLKAAAALQPSRPLRCMATLGGDVAARRHDSCLPEALMACGTVLELAGDAALGVQQYLSRQRRDLILFARVPLGRRACLTRQRRSSRGAVLVTAAVGYDEDQSNVVVAVGGAGLAPQRVTEAEKLLEQGSTAPAALEKVVRTSLHFESDWLGSAGYKAHLAAVSVTQCVAGCRQGKAYAD